MFHSIAFHLPIPRRNRSSVSLGGIKMVGNHCQNMYGNLSWFHFKGTLVTHKISAFFFSLSGMDDGLCEGEALSCNPFFKYQNPCCAELRTQFLYTVHQKHHISGNRNTADALLPRSVLRLLHSW